MFLQFYYISFQLTRINEIDKQTMTIPNIVFCFCFSNFLCLYILKHEKRLQFIFVQYINLVHKFLLQNVQLWTHTVEYLFNEYGRFCFILVNKYSYFDLVTLFFPLQVYFVIQAIMQLKVNIHYHTHRTVLLQSQ